ncbi:MAG: hypothetical protein P0Y49_09160 [Candidatus Pedobacter colombiensis]|uniref:Uncharacterized protein n=1 Tax=Candidatus Pedobacter colombiensis TaxID=3121371 RepID=A0AAJ5W9L6_9SPHI|nr:hypothetical protein [Pedobacter sp.]WEK21308.1 MAG: hypothetical protein P0Y49_09160 [Pedobacter sp.]
METRIIAILFFTLSFCRSVLAQEMIGIPNGRFDISKMIVYKRDFSPIQLHSNDPERKIYILKNNKSCLKCFSEITNYLQSLMSQTDSIKFCSISLCDSSVFQMKNYIYENKTTMGILDNLFVFYPSVENTEPLQAPSNSIFNLYNIDITPAIVMQYKNKLVLVRYQEMYLGSNFSKATVSSAFSRVFR